MKRGLGTLLLVLSVPFLCGFALEDCRFDGECFERVSERGFDPADNEADYNDYPWSMVHFTPDGAQTGHVYVGTGNNIDDMIYYFCEFESMPGATGRPPEIRRHRPDLGPREWERVFDYRDVEPGPVYSSTGFRNLVVYRSAHDGVNYLYGSTFGKEPKIWRTPSGEPGSWELAWSAESSGSIRWMATHNDLLYIAISNDVVMSFMPGQIWATDGHEFWPVIQDGFGNPDNLAVMSLISYNGWLYAGTSNTATGFEIWRLEGPGPEGATPVRIMAGGGTSAKNQVASTPCLFKGDLYWGTMIPGGLKLRGCELFRIRPDDSWDVIVGPHSLSGYRGGFNNRFNAYIWWLEEHEGVLYAGTFDTTSILQFFVDHPDLVAELFTDLPEILERAGPLVEQYLGGSSKRRHTLLSATLDMGADLYKSADGLHWTPVFDNGLGNPYNYGIRTMASVDGLLYLGMANPFEGLEIYRTCPVD